MARPALEQTQPKVVAFEDHFVIVCFNASQVTERGSVLQSTLAGLPNVNSRVAAMIERTFYFLGGFPRNVSIVVMTCLGSNNEWCMRENVRHISLIFHIRFRVKVQ